MKKTDAGKNAENGSETVGSEVTRRGALKKAVWTAPVLMTMNVPDRVFAQSAVSPAPSGSIAPSTIGTQPPSTLGTRPPNTRPPTPPHTKPPVYTLPPTPPHTQPPFTLPPTPSPADED